MCFLFFRALVKSGFETCLDTYEADPAIIEKNSVYDPDDYSPVFLQVFKYVAKQCYQLFFKKISEFSVKNNRFEVHFVQQGRDFIIFLPLRFFVKSVLAISESQK